MKYAQYCHNIDIDGFEEAIGFDPIRHDTNKHGEPEDIGHCFDPWNLHKNGDTTGKLAINREKKIYGCFVCGGGTLLSLVSAVKGCTDQEAERWLEQFAQPHNESDDRFMSEVETILREEQREKVTLPWYNEHVLDKWMANIGRIDHWLGSRGISSEVAHKARLGYEPNAQRFHSDKPYVGPCIYFPHFWGERLVGWQQRWLDEDRPKWVAKYTNTSGFPKSETLYHFEDVYLSTQPIIVCESVPTVLFLEGVGYPAIATFGGSVTDEQMRLLRYFTQGVVLAPDNDAPGRKWSGSLAEYLARFVPVKVMEPVGEYNSGADLGDLIFGGFSFAQRAISLLYREAEYFLSANTN